MTESTWAEGLPRRILLATDLSARCDRALDRAVALANEWQAELLALHVLEQTDDFYAAEVERRLPSWRRPLDATLRAEQQLRRDMMPLTTRFRVIIEKGEPAQAIERVATAEGCDLIVTGLARDETFGRYWMGATVDRLLRRTEVPLLVVKGRARATYQHIVVATDFSSASREALQAALAFFPEQRLTVFHAYDAPMSGLVSDKGSYQEAYGKLAGEECAKFLATVKVPDGRHKTIEQLVEHGHPRPLIERYTRDKGIDLVVLGTQGRGAVLGFLLGSTARDIMTTLPCDALVIRGGAAKMSAKKRQESGGA